MMSQRFSEPFKYSIVSYKHRHTFQIIPSRKYNFHLGIVLLILFSFFFVIFGKLDFLFFYVRECKDIGKRNDIMVTDLLFYNVV